MVTYLGSLVQSCSGKGGTLQASLTGLCGECLQCLSHTGFAPAHSVCAFMFYTAQALGCSAGELSEAGPGLRVLPGLSCSGSGSRVLHKGAYSVGPAFCALPSSEQLRRPGAWQSQSPPGGEGILSPPPSQPLGFLGGSKSAVSGVLCVLWRADLWLRPSRWM